MSNRPLYPAVWAHLSERPVAIPGVIGVIEAQDVTYALIGPDAGWPTFPPMDERTRGRPVYRVGDHRNPAVLSAEVTEGQESTPPG